MAGGVYALQGSRNFPQVEPSAAFWLRCPTPRTVSLEEIRRELDHIVEDYHDSGSASAQRDLAQVKTLSNFNNSHDPNFFRTNENLSQFLRVPRFLIDSVNRMRVPPGAVINRRNPFHVPLLRYGAELARLFEAETPGLWHRHVLNVLLDPTIPMGFGQRLSPPRQALIWAALDVTISSALQAAWYFKWFELRRFQISYRERPWEADNTLDVLFDYNVTFNNAGDIVRGTLRTDPRPTPGTPRHPAYPSGHSTYSAAASTLLGCLFPDYRVSFNKLANNIGRARLWAGVHWFQDHTTGQLIGKTVAQLVIRQLNESGIRPIATPTQNVPDDARLRQIEADFYEAWRTRKDFCTGIGIITPPDPALAGIIMNPAPVIEAEPAEEPLPPGERDGELDVDTLRE